MKSSHSMQQEVISLVLWLLVMMALGAVFDIALLSLLVAFSLYVVWHLYNVNRLIKWLNSPSKNVPESMGVWDEAFLQLNNQYKRQRKSRKKLAKVLKRFQKSTKALPYATIVLNSKNEIEWFNPASRALFGFRSGIDVGQRIDNLIRQPRFIKYLNTKRFDKPLEFELQNKTILLNITSYGKGQNLLSANDITLQIKIDEMRRDFISNASHELRTPITVMSGYVEILQNHADESNKYPIDKIQQQIIRMEKIISELIELAKLEASEPVSLTERIDVTQLINEVYDEAVAFDQNKHDIKLNAKEILINGQYEEVRIAVSNLLTNAIRYTPENGEITLSTFMDDVGSYIQVEDNGVGIEYEHISRLTERFYRVDDGRSRKVGGTGLGLAIVKQILDRHGAALQIQSEINKGSTFRCYFKWH